jgi:pimeloyl-ACP methyl ester carboxylesterase
MESQTKGRIMEAPTTRLFHPARIVALALIALALGGLVYLHASSGSTEVAVPKDAHAGQLTLHSCDYATEDGSFAADCGTLVVPENRHDPGSRLIALPVKRIRALSAHPGKPVFRLQGGPGITNMTFPQASRLAKNHDVVLVGYRGVDGSERLDCPEVVASRESSRDFLGKASFDSDTAALRECAARLKNDGVDLAGYSIPQTVDDLEAARRALGYGKVDLVSESFGTRIAMIYAWRYPRSIHRSAMIGVNPPGHFLWGAETTQEQLEKYAALCADDDDCRARTSDLTASVNSTYHDLPSRWGFLPIKKGNVKTGAFIGLFDATSDGEAGPLNGPMTLDNLLSIDAGDASGAWLLSVATQLAFPRAQAIGEVASMARTDASYAKRFFPAHRGSALGSDFTKFVWADGGLVCAWPANPDEKLYSRVQDSRVETLLIGGALDFTTPPQVATRELLPHLPNGRQVVLPKLGHAGDFWSYEPKASTRLIDTYLSGGRVDTSLYTTNHIDFTPRLGQDTLAKIVLTVMLGLAALTVLSLVWMAVRVSRRGAMGRKTSVAVRSLYVLVLGVGGWFAGVLVALTALPTVPVTSELLAGLSIGLPVGLAIYLAWLHTDWPGRTRTIGLAGSLAAALVGAWLGFNVIDGLFAVVTASLGAQLGANLTLIVFDILRERAVPEAVPEAPRVTARA